MEGLINTFNAFGYAARMFDAACSFLFSLVEYMPAIIGSAVIIFIAIYVVRFCLLK